MERRQVELADEERLAAMQVDRALMDGRVGAAALDEAEHGSRRSIDDGERVGIGGTERHVRSGVILAGPDDAGRRLLQSRVGARCVDRLRAERRGIVVRDRRFVGSGAHMTGKHARVRVVEDRCLDAAAEQLVGLPHEELIERVLGRDQNGEPVAATSRASPLLAQGRDRAREADGDDRIEQADVDPELERVRRGDSEQLAGGEPLLDLAAFVRRVAGAVRR